MTTAAQALLTQARGLWAGRFQGVLSTHSEAQPGYPFGSLVPYCLDRSGHPLFLLSHLAQHTRNLLANPRCAFTLYEATREDLQQSLRLTCVAQCHPMAPDASAEVERYLRYYPASRPYWEQLNFQLFRLEPLRFHLNGGFATARWAATGEILLANPFADAEEGTLIAELTAQHLDAIGRLALRQYPSADAMEAVAIAGVDAAGIDLRLAGAPLRVTLPDQVSSAAALSRLLQSA
jgi:heme iron utilization protein